MGKQRAQVCLGFQGEPDCDSEGPLAGQKLMQGGRELSIIQRWLELAPTVTDPRQYGPTWVWSRYSRSWREG